MYSTLEIIAMSLIVGCSVFLIPVCIVMHKINKYEKEKNSGQ